MSAVPTATRSGSVPISENPLSPNRSRQDDTDPRVCSSQLSWQLPEDWAQAYEAAKPALRNDRLTREAFDRYITDSILYALGRAPRLPKSDDHRLSWNAELRGLKDATTALAKIVRPLSQTPLVSDGYLDETASELQNEWQHRLASLEAMDSGFVEQENLHAPSSSPADSSSDNSSDSHDSQASVPRSRSTEDTREADKDAAWSRKKGHTLASPFHSKADKPRASNASEESGGDIWEDEEEDEGGEGTRKTGGSDSKTAFEKQTEQIASVLSGVTNLCKATTNCARALRRSPVPTCVTKTRTTYPVYSTPPRATFPTARSHIRRRVTVRPLGPTSFTKRRTVQVVS